MEILKSPFNSIQKQNQKIRKTNSQNACIILPWKPPAIMKKLKKTDGERHHVYILEDASSLQIYL